MDNLFGQKIIEYNTGEIIFLSSSNIFSKCQCTNWEHNRPCDEKRIDEIYQDIVKCQKIDGIIYIAQVIKNDNIDYICYDGNHRRLALERYQNDIPILISVIFNASNNQIVRNFVKLNKSCPVPTLYIDKKDRHNTIIKNIIYNVVKYFTDNYPKYISTSRNPQRPNFNRDNFIDKLYTFIKQHKINLDQEELLDYLLDINKQYKLLVDNNQIVPKISQRVKDKCDKYKLYLFVKDFSDDLFIKYSN